ncbi:DUF3558 domain-containing protein [Streptomyces sp. FIT100]|uniref:DUF3558 domain-containing protein n=1 Tax=Streptomyces sp. FIT100 TaxID=2837956 RepID=UPI0021C68B57|nr:DUF3558 domain-containing protein [Streptomyces sp. FIT100]UUN28467.1 DUF3558 domain-containing protein [Streptomyces sp. FIT100]
MHRSAPRLTRIFASAAIPVMLVVAGCSSDSGSGSDKASGSDTPSGASTGAKPSVAAVEPAKFAKLPEPCKAIASKTVLELVPKAKNKAGTAGTSSDTGARGGCSWNGLEDKGVKGSNYRWLDVAFLRYESESGLGSGEKRAKEAYAKEVAKNKATEDAKNVKTSPAAGVGDEATAISYDLSKTDETFKYATIVARTGNVVVTLGYNGAGYAGAKTPDAADLMKDAMKAAKEAAASVATANK